MAAIIKLKETEMPKYCGACRFESSIEYMITGYSIETHSIRDATCPLVKIPEQEVNTIEIISCTEDELKRILELEDVQLWGSSFTIVKKEV